MSRPGGGSRSQQLEVTLLTAALVVAVVVTIADAIWHFLRNATWALPLIFLVLIVVVRTLDAIRDRVVALTGETRIQAYDTLGVYYSALMRAVQDADRCVYAVFSHDTSPIKQTDESREYYEACMRWARRHSGERTFQRVIRLPAASPDIEEWVDAQKDLAREVDNYHVRVLRYPRGMDPEGENFAVIDSSVVFLGFAMSDREEMKGFSVRDARVAAAFEQHFRELWRLASGRDERAQASPVVPDQVLDVAHP